MKEMILPMTNIIYYEHKAIQEQYKKECEILHPLLKSNRIINGNDSSFNGSSSSIICTS